MCHPFLWREPSLPVRPKLISTYKLDSGALECNSVTFASVSKKRFAVIFKGQGSQEEYSVDCRKFAFLRVRNNVSGKIFEQTS
jgi:hypothetical protein